MGATLMLKEFDVDQPSQTEELSNWILRIRSKKISCRRNRRRDLRVEAMLTCSLFRAEYELRHKQTSRFRKWQQVKGRLMISANGCKNDNNFYCNSQKYSNSYAKRKDAWQEPLCSELSSLNTFMSLLKEIKVPLQR